MKRIVRNRFAVIVLLMLAVAMAALLTTSTIEAGGGGGKCFCPQPPEGCSFQGCDIHHNCLYLC